MEAKEFENSIKQRFVQHGAVTPESVWDAIAGDLDKKRRIVGFWWWNSLSALCILLLATSFYWNMDQTPVEAQNQSLLTIAKTSQQNKSTINNEATRSGEPKEIQELPVKKDALTQPDDDRTSAQMNALKAKPRNLLGVKSDNLTRNQTETDSESQRTHPTRNAKIVDERLWLEPLGYSELTTENGQRIEIVSRREKKRLYRPTIGLQMSTFANLSNPRASHLISQTANATADPSNSNSIGYFKFLEATPYYQFDFKWSNSNIRVLSLISFANSSGRETNSDWTGTHCSYGAGLGFSHYFQLNPRTRIGLYGASQWEMSFNQITNHSGAEVVDSTSMPTGLVQESVTSKNRQNMVSLEAGAELNYYLSYRTRLYFNLGYRNYFWQQKATSTFQLQIPQLMKFSIGLSYAL